MSELLINLIKSRHSIGTELALGWTKDQVLERYGWQNVKDKEVYLASENITLADDFRAKLRLEETNLASAASINNMDAFGLSGAGTVQFDYNSTVVDIQWTKSIRCPLTVLEASVVEQSLIRAFGVTEKHKFRNHYLWIWPMQNKRAQLSIHVDRIGLNVSGMLVQVRALPHGVLA